MKDHHPRIQRILEVGCGTGSMTKYISALFPEAHITALDLSAPYLWKARQRLKDHVNIDFIQGDGAKLPFNSGSFDAVVSCFLFHELPKEERKKVLQESHRVLKPSGFMGLIDSIQKDDNADLNWALDDFPLRFHEPFYKNYILTPMEHLTHEAGFHDIHTQTGYFAKAVWGRK
jgi:ubiquinone/menaquinone biosynthesis C-methylase UbiE